MHDDEGRSLYNDRQVHIARWAEFERQSSTDAQFLQHAQSLFLVFTAQHPELVVLVLHDVSQYGAAKEHHVFPARWILDANFKLL